MVTHGTKYIITLKFSILKTIVFICLLALISIQNIKAEELNDRNKIIYSNYNKAISSIKIENYVDFDDAVNQLRLELKNSNYINAPNFSFEFINLVQKYNIDSFNRLRILNGARIISPTHPEVLFSLSTHIADFGIFESFTLSKTAFNNLIFYPLFSLTLLLKLMLLIWISLFVCSIFIPCLHMVLQPADSLSFFATFIPKNKRAPISVFSLIIVISIFISLPLVIFGLLCSAFSGLVSSRLKYYPLLSSSLFLLFIFFVSPVEQLLSFSNSNIGRNLDSLWANDFILDSNKIENLKKKIGNIAIADLATGQLNQAVGKIEDANNHFNNIISAGFNSDGIINVVRSNKAHIDFQNGKQELAFNQWKQMYDEGKREKELLYNLAIASVALYRNAEYQKYFSELKKFETWTKIELTDITPRSAKLPYLFYWEFAFSQLKSNFLISSGQYAKYFGDNTMILSFIVSILIFIFSLVLVFKETSPYRYKVSFNSNKDILLINKFLIFKNIPSLSFYFNENKNWFFIKSSIVFVVLVTLFFTTTLFRFSSNVLALFFVFLLLCIEFLRTYLNYKNRGKAV